MPFFRLTDRVPSTLTRVVVVGSTMLCLRRALLAQLEATGVRSATVGTYCWPMEDCPVAFDGGLAPAAVVAVVLQGTATITDTAKAAVERVAAENGMSFLDFVPGPTSRFSCALPGGIRIVIGDLAALAAQPISSSHVVSQPLQQFKYAFDWLFVSLLLGFLAWIAFRETTLFRKVLEALLASIASIPAQLFRSNELQVRDVHIWLNPYLRLPGEPFTRYDPDHARHTLWRPLSLRPGALYRSLEKTIRPDFRRPVFLAYQVYEANGVVHCNEITHFSQLKAGRPLYYFTVDGVRAAARFLSAFDEGNQALAKRYLTVHPA